MMKQHQPHKQSKRHTLYSPKQRTVSLKSAAWLKLRAQVLAEEPLCQHCRLHYDRIRTATDVDHQDNNGDNNARSNLVPLCHSCHSIKTRAEQQGKAPRPVYGCDEHGRPRDPGHLWNQKITSNQWVTDRRGSHARAPDFKEFRP